MGEKTMLENIQSCGLKKVLSYLDSDPDENIPKVLKWVERFDREKAVKDQLDLFYKVLADQESNWYKLVKSLWSDIDGGVRKTLFANFLVNATILGAHRKNKVIKENDCSVPWAILLDPTSACNLHCQGCWAADYGSGMSMSFEDMDKIISQGKELGTYMYIYSGGEPLMRKADIIRLCEKHNDCAFLAFTNGTLIDEDFARAMLRVGNFVPAISVEGFAAETDFRRGKGTYQRLTQAMAILKDKKLPFGISCCYTSKNTEVIGSEAYFDDMIAKGAKFAWFFTYMPVGVNAVPELMATAEQRRFMYRQIRNFRSTKPLFTMDFWNDGEYVDGCIAGARYYLHINAAGDIEPCAFIHYSNCNIKDTTLLEAYQSPLFKQYRSRQPFNNNHLRPCPLLDNPAALADMVTAAGAKSTDMKSPEDVRELCAKCSGAAAAWGPVADELWQKERGAKEKPSPQAAAI